MHTNQPIDSYRDFWPYYLREHSKPSTRAIHYAGTLVATASLAALIGTGNDWFGLAAVIGGYGFAWVAHFFVEKNRPATFTYPLWSLASDYRMTWTWLTGGLARELAKAGVENQR